MPTRFSPHKEHLSHTTGDSFQLTFFFLLLDKDRPGAYCLGERALADAEPAEYPQNRGAKGVSGKEASNSKNPSFPRSTSKGAATGTRHRRVSRSPSCAPVGRPWSMTAMIDICSSRLDRVFVCVVAVFGFALCPATLGVWAAPLPAIIDLNGIAGNGTPASILRVYGDDASDRLGSDLSNGIAYGDVNGDGFDDIVIGAYRGDPPGGYNAGEVYIIYGNAVRMAAPVDLDTDGAISAAGETRILGDNESDWAGSAVACGDVNGDGYDDVVIGAEAADPGGRDHAGEVYIIYGGTGLPGTTVDLNSTPGSNGETRILGDNPFDEAGYAVSCGDVNGDGYDDVLIGAHYADPAGGGEAGEVYIVYGGAAIGADVIDLSDAPGTHGETRILGDDAGDYLGHAVSSGDVNGDGYDDIIIGAVGADPDGRAAAGEVYIVYGGLGLPGTTVDLNSTPGSNGETRILGGDADDQCGWSVAAGDVNGDGCDDVIIGARNAAPAGRTQAGEAYIVYGSATLPATTVNLNAPPGSNNETRILGDGAGDQCGWSVAAGDVNGDGLADVVLGAFLGDPPGGVDGGELFLIYGNAALPATVVDLSAGEEDVRVLGDDAGDWFGFGAEAGGDMDRDGKAEFAASAYYGDNPSIGGDNNTGYAVNVYGDGNPVVAVAVEGFPAGDTPARGFGGHLAPVMRLWLGFEGGDAATATVTLTPTDAGITNLGDGSLDDVADVVWEITTTRTGWATAEIRVQYLDIEVAGLVEGDLVLAQAPALNGPWTQVGVQALDMARNMITARTPESGFFAITEADLVPPEVTLEQGATQDDPVNVLPIVFDVVFTEPVVGFDDNDMDDMDVLFSGTAGVTAYTVVDLGGGDAYRVEVTAVAGDGTIIATVPGALCEDLAGNPSRAATSVDNTVLLDRTPPVAGTVVSDAGPYTNDNTQLSFSWSGFSDGESGLIEYEVALGTTGNPEAREAFRSAGLAEAYTFDTGPYIDGPSVCTVRAWNAAGDSADAQAGVLVDTTRPTQGTVTSDAGAYTSDNTHLAFSWSGFNDPQSGIA
ncbi:MAG TPA: hypothetical protein ENN80_00945, partial [Candidatus Hydrogenedentes bacterium]|nr:hypothetical protein [Candidatus Hydrogenedentota bacterium]